MSGARGVGEGARESGWKEWHERGGGARGGWKEWHKRGWGITGERGTRERKERGVGREERAGRGGGHES